MLRLSGAGMCVLHALLLTGFLQMHFHICYSAQSPKKSQDRMTRKKHLVLDHDVYLRLMRRKRETGLTASVIGNAILRTCLDGNASLYRQLRERLVASGDLTERAFDEAFRNMVCSLAEMSEEWRGLRDSDEESCVVGSWEVRKIGICEGACRVLEFAARDGRDIPIVLHYHPEESRIQVLAGQVLFIVDYQHMLLGAPEALTIPSGCFHAATPLTDDARFLSVLVPPGQQ
jgi:hypothetical protein